MIWTEQPQPGKQASDRANDHEPTEAARILDSLADGLMVLDRDWRYTYVNAQAERLVGRTRAELLGRCFWDEFPFTPGTDVERELRRAVLEQVVCEFGGYSERCGRWHEHRACPTPDGGVIVYFREVTKRKQAEDALRESEERLRFAADLVGLSNYEWRLGTPWVAEWDARLRRMWGLSPDAPVDAEMVMAAIHPDDRPVVESALARSLDPAGTGGYAAEYRVVGIQDGVERWLSSVGRTIFHDGKPVRFIGTAMEITERKQAEQAERENAKRLQKLSRRVVEVQEEERRRLARELHDEIGQALTAVGMNLLALKRFGNDEIMPRLHECVAIVDGAIGQVRQLSIDLRPSILDDLGLVAALRWYFDRQARRVGYRPHFGADRDDVRLSPEAATTAFRVAQEALTNIARHARAENVWLELRLLKGALLLTIRDDGCGFDSEARLRRPMGAESLGLMGMLERAAQVGGHVAIQSSPGRGTEVRLTVPRNPAAERA